MVTSKVKYVVIDDRKLSLREVELLTMARTLTLDDMIELVVGRVHMTSPMAGTLEQHLKRGDFDEFQVMAKEVATVLRRKLEERRLAHILKEFKSKGAVN